MDCSCLLRVWSCGWLPQRADSVAAWANCWWACSRTHNCVKTNSQQRSAHDILRQQSDANPSLGYAPQVKCTCRVKSCARLSKVSALAEGPALGAVAPFPPAFCGEPGLLQGVWVAAGAAASAEAGPGLLAAAAASTSGPGAASTGVGTVAAASAAPVVAVADVAGVAPSAGWLNVASASDTAFRTAGALRASSCAAASAAMLPTSLCNSASQGAQAASWCLVVWMAARRAIRTGRRCCNSSVAASRRRS